MQHHIDDLLQWGVIQPLPRGSRGVLGGVFLTEKADGTTSRCIFDARRQNALVNHCALEGHGRFRLLRPYAHILIGLGTGLRIPRLAEIDYTSYFFEFSWAPMLARAHAFRHGGKRYGFKVGVQGGTLMPLVAQVASAIIAEAPAVDAPASEYIDALVSITYDNILIAAESTDVEARWERLLDRSRRAGAVVGTTKPPTCRLVSCGIEFDVSDPTRRRWRVAPDWAAKARSWVQARRTAIMTLDERRTLAGLAAWALRVALAPLWRIRPLLELKDGAEAVVWLTNHLHLNDWRSLRAPPARTVPSDATVVVVDGSIIGVGVVTGGWAWAEPWPTRRNPEEQQAIEWRAALRGVQRASQAGTAVLLVGDNVGVLAALVTGNARTTEGAETMSTIEAALQVPLWLAYVPSSRNWADAPSREEVGRKWRSAWTSADEDGWRKGAVLAEWTMAERLP